MLQWMKENIPDIKGLNAFSLTASKALLYSANFSWLKMQYFAKKSSAKRREEDKDKPLALSDRTRAELRSKRWLFVDYSEFQLE